MFRLTCWAFPQFFEVFLEDSHRLTLEPTQSKTWLICNEQAHSMGNISNEQIIAK